MHFIKKILIVSAALSVLGAGCLSPTPVKVPPPPAPKPTAAYGQSVTLKVGETVTFSDGFSVKLNAINDSRCGQGHTCIWAGELAAELLIQDKNGSETIRLGTITKPSLSARGHDFVLKDITETSATLIIS